MPQVIENFVPETRIEQVQNRVLDSSYIKIGTSRGRALARPHPVTFIFGVSQEILLPWIEVTQLVAARTRPVGHHISVAVIGLFALPQIQFYFYPFAGAPQRRFRL